jgi:hypothetical protein
VKLREIESWGVKLRESEVQGGISKRVVVQGGLVKFPPLIFYFIPLCYNESSMLFYKAWLK